MGNSEELRRANDPINSTQAAMANMRIEDLFAIKGSNSGMKDRFNSNFGMGTNAPGGGSRGGGGTGQMPSSLVGGPRKQGGPTSPSSPARRHIV